MKYLTTLILLIATSMAVGAPRPQQPKEPAPTIEPTGPVRMARYVKPFAQAAPSRVTRDYSARYTYGTPSYFYGCGYYGCYGYGYYGGGWYSCRPICYPYGPYYPCY